MSDQEQTELLKDIKEVLTSVAQSMVIQTDILLHTQSKKTMEINQTWIKKHMFSMIDEFVKKEAAKEEEEVTSTK